MEGTRNHRGECLVNCKTIYRMAKLLLHCLFLNYPKIFFFLKESPHGFASPFSLSKHLFSLVSAWFISPSASKFFLCMMVYFWSHPRPCHVRESTVHIPHGSATFCSPVPFISFVLVPLCTLVCVYDQLKYFVPICNSICSMHYAIT